MALGFFDGVHIGHAALMNKTKERAEKLGVSPSVLTFDVHPDNLVFNKEVELINGASGRESIIKKLFGIDEVVFIHFNQYMMHMEWEQFVEVLIKELNIVWLVVGHDFRFGYKGRGTAKLLKEYCEAHGLGCDIIEAVKKDGVIVSSTIIRELIANGEIEKANELLGHPHMLTDTVRAGYHLGTSMGAPTINMKFPEGVLIPKHGVYAAKVYLEDGSEHMCVTNIGVRPTFGEQNSVSVESFILGFSGDLYGNKVRLELYSFLREEKKFESAEKLSAQIKLDAEDTLHFFEKQSNLS